MGKNHTRIIQQASNTRNNLDETLFEKTFFQSDCKETKRIYLFLEDVYNYVILENLTSLSVIGKERDILPTTRYVLVVVVVVLPSVCNNSC